MSKIFDAPGMELNLQVCYVELEVVQPVGTARIYLDFDSGLELKETQEKINKNLRALSQEARTYTAETNSRTHHILSVTGTSLLKKPCRLVVLGRVAGQDLVEVSFIVLRENLDKNLFGFDDGRVRSIAASELDRYSQLVEKLL